MRLMIKSAVVVSLCGAVGCMSQPIRLPAETGELNQLSIATTRPGFEGAGYVEGFTNDTGELSFSVRAPRRGVYDLEVRYSCDGPKGYSLTINDVGYDGMLPASPKEFSTARVGKVELVSGMNRLSLGKGWGFYRIDSITLIPSKPYAKPRPIEPTLVNADATPATRALMKRLTEAYGKFTYSGLMNDHDVGLVRAAAGVTPAMIGGDLIDYSPSRLEHGADPRGETERLFAAHRAGHMVTTCWHWNAPSDLINKKEHVNQRGATIDASWYKGFYTEATTYDMTIALADENSPARALMIRDIDAIAVELKKLQAADVPVLWRPLHESDGAWFWWGAKGPEPFKQLWRIVFDRLTHHHQLNNLIWVYTWNDPAWYPGDDVVDIVGIDAYPAKVNDPLTQHWERALQHFDGKKLVTLSEVGGVPDLDRMHRLGVRWSYYTSWTGSNGPAKNPPDELPRLLRSPYTRHLQETQRR